ncbi:MAG: metallophosphoesterase [Patescibacteria group bacterium]|nr:metallophosphoesterase [Patescibacteria group bacterium]
MKIAIISDTHDNVPNLEKTLAWLKSQGVSLIVHCGDLCAPAMLNKVLIPNFSGQIHLVYGNVSDRESLKENVKEFKNVNLHGDFGKLKIDGKKIAFVHQQEEAEKIAKTQKYDLVFYGHSHKPWEKKIGQTRLVNPGNLAGMFYKATFAVYDTETDKLELKILERL